MRQIAWLNTAPKPRPRKHAPKQPPAPPMTRLQQLQADDMQPDVPDAGPAGYIIGRLFDVGPTSFGGMGAIPLAWSDLAQWQHATGTPLQAWEARQLRRLSCDYLNAKQEAEDPDCPAPYLLAPTPERRALVDQKLRGAIAERTAKPARGSAPLR